MVEGVKEVITHYMEVLFWLGFMAIVASVISLFIIAPGLAKHNQLMNEPVVKGSLKQWRGAKRRATLIQGCYQWSDSKERFIVYNLKDC